MRYDDRFDSAAHRRDTTGSRICVLAALTMIIGCQRGSPLGPPITAHVSATAGWQSIGTSVKPGQAAVVAYVRGTIRDRETVIPDASGSDYVCGVPACCEPLPNERRSALIARVGSRLFAIGNHRRIVSDEGGEILLRINDCDEGLADNSGELEVRIEPTRR